MKLTFFDIISFWITLFSKMMPNFWHLPINPILNSQNSIISFCYVDFYANIFLILYPWSWTSITGNAIVIIYPINELSWNSRSLISLGCLFIFPPFCQKVFTPLAFLLLIHKVALNERLNFQVLSHLEVNSLCTYYNWDRFLINNNN